MPGNASWLRICVLFVCRIHPYCRRLLSRSAYIGKAAKEASTYHQLTRFNITRSMNQYMTHWFYPYKGKFHPQMTRALINIIGLKKGDVLLDPFSGSGTAAVEGALLGLKTVCFDVSPLCVLMGKIKANAMHHLAKITAYQKTAQNSRAEDIPIADAMANPAIGFEMLARLISLSDEARRGRNYEKQLLANRKKMLESITMMRTGCKESAISPPPATVKIGDARRLPLADESVDGVVTSPPYSIALNYVANDEHALRALGFNPDQAAENFIGVRGRGEDRLACYDEDMRLAYGEIARVLKPDAQAVIVLGNITMNGTEVGTLDVARKFLPTWGFVWRKKLIK